MEFPPLIRRQTPRAQRSRDTQPIPVDELRRLLREMNESEHERPTVRANPFASRVR